ncbi:hypothetical protein ccbrp13_41310 [Ktedonobacteria bacterium brp13]|nr:hypothetical protein ccbrp13_41310 [Ktedonobacteria bacterium brp13]
MFDIVVLYLKHCSIQAIKLDCINVSMYSSKSVNMYSGIGYLKNRKTSRHTGEYT